MDLAGKTTTLGLAEVFQNIAFNSHTGSLTLKQGEQKAQIAFEGGRIRAVKVDEADLDYFDIARRCQLASEEVLAKAEGANLKRTLRAFLQASGDLDEERYDATIAGYVEDTILPLFGWKAAAFNFEEGKLKTRVFDKEQLGCGVELDPTGVAMEAARRHDEWETIQPYVPTDKEVLVHAAVQEFELSPTAERLLPLFDGTRTLAEVVKEAPFKEFEVSKTVAGMVEAGCLEQATALRVLELALQARASGKVTLAARRLEVALQLDPDDLQPRVELVRLYERAGRKLDAATEQVKLGGIQAERGDTEGALESFERAAVLAPDDLDILEKIHGLHETRGETTRAMRVGRKLAEALVAQEMYEDALPLYERLLEGSGENHVGLRESLANCLLKLEETGRAAEQLVLVGDAAFEQNEFRTARRYYQRVLEFDAENEAATSRLAEIDSGEADARVVRRKRRRLMLAAAAVAALLVVQAAREWLALGSLHVAHHGAVKELARDNADSVRPAILAAYASLCDEYPATRAASRAHATLEALLLDETERIDRWIGWAENPDTPLGAESSVKLAERQLVRIDEIDLPADLRESWAESAESMRIRLDRLRGK